MKEKYLNVSEAIPLHDTILVGSEVNSLEFHDGWATSFAALGSQTKFPFFSVRNRNHGLAYCNQDARDNSPYGMRIYSLGVQFFAPSLQAQGIEPATADGNFVSYWKEMQSIWCNDLPFHLGVNVRIQQDDRLESNVCLAPSGVGTVGGGWVQGSHSGFQCGPIGAPTPEPVMATQGMSEPSIKNMFHFGMPLEVPRRATFSVDIIPTAYARGLLSAMPGPYSLGWLANHGVTPTATYHPCYFGMRVFLKSERLVQQRGNYHV